MAKNPNTTFCPVPWSYLFTATNGSYKSCVAAYSSPSKAALYDDQGALLRVSSHSIEDVRHSEVLQKLRKDMLAGLDSPSICQRCITEEEHGLTSRRQLERINNYLTLEEAQSFTDPSGKIDTEQTPLRVMDVKVGNLCNLACRMCGPNQSSGWYDEWFKTRFKGFRDSGDQLRLTESNPKIQLIEDPYQWHEDKSFWDQAFKHISSLREIHFSGGEPFLSAKHTEVLRKLVASGASQDICLTYNTNLTVLPAYLKRLWQDFKRVRIGVSVDGLNEVNDYVRHPSQFHKIVKNLEQLDSMPSKIDYWLTSTLSIHNISGYPDLIQWLLTTDLVRINREMRGPTPVFFTSAHVLREPAHLNITALPKICKEQVRKRFEKFINSLTTNGFDLSEEERSQLVAHLQGILSAMEAEDTREDLYRFYIETKKSDLYRNQDFGRIDAETWKSVCQHLEETGQLDQAQRMAEKRWW